MVPQNLGQIKRAGLGVKENRTPDGIGPPVIV
jgi:hypothetical protein